MSNFHQRILEIQQSYVAKIQAAQAAGQYTEVTALVEQMNKALEKVMLEMQKPSEPEKAPVIPLRKSQHYRYQDCTLDLDAFIYDGDRVYFEKLINNPLIRQVCDTQMKDVFNSKKDLLKHALRLSPTMAPKVFKALDLCKEKLGLNSKVDIYVSQNPTMNASCFPPHNGVIYIHLTSAILEKLNEGELAFVIGHEIGHFLYQHHFLNPGMLLKQLGHHLSPSESISLFSWMRYGELSADRIGLICCGDFQAACTANFKISSGVTTEALSFSLEEYLTQFSEMEQEMAQGGGNIDDFYSTHPINPIRVVALDIFYKSETFTKPYLPEKQFEYTEDQMEKKIDGFLSLLEPSYLRSNDDSAKQIKETIFLAGMAVSSADGTIDQKEMTQLSEILQGENYSELYAKIQTWSVEMILQAVFEQIEKTKAHMSIVTRCNIIRDLAVISTIDGNLSEGELQCLFEIAIHLNIDPVFVDQVLQSIQIQSA
jgi:uncharacterized tellurite resistance protein B-like protein